MQVRFLRNLLLGVSLVLALAGCANFAPHLDTTPVTQTEVFQLGNAYGVAQSAAVSYASFPQCSEAMGITKLCRSPAVTKLLAQYDAAFNTAYLRLTAFVRDPANYPGLSFGQLYSAAQSALATLTDAEKAYNVGKVQ